MPRPNGGRGRVGVVEAAVATALAAAALYLLRDGEELPDAADDVPGAVTIVPAQAGASPSPGARVVDAPAPAPSSADAAGPAPPGPAVSDPIGFAPFIDDGSDKLDTPS